MNSGPLSHAVAPLAAAAPGYSVLGALIVFIVASIWLGTLAQRRIEKGSFLKGYFLGNRGLGAWTMALTATVQSGGTFMGFPSLVYTHGWVVTLWIAGYMVVPLTGFAVVGKRLAQLSRRTGAITVPDLFRARFNSPAAGLTASLLILVFMGAMMIAQFKAGAIVMKIAWPGNTSLALSEELPEKPATPDAKTPDASSLATTTPASKSADSAASATNSQPQGWVNWLFSTDDGRYLLGLILFSATVVGYTLIGGFLASVWTDLFQSIMMLIGVMILLFLVMRLPNIGGIEQATKTAMQNTGPGFAFAPGFSDPAKEPRQFLTTGIAVSTFFIWVFAGVGSPASMVRVMATRNTEVLRRSIFLLAIYNCMIYIPLIMICIAARAAVPHLDKPDEIIPRIAMLVTADIPGGGLITGLIFAAPFGAVMATVSCYLLVIASGLVKDIYLRFIRPGAGVREIRTVTYTVMITVGLLAIALNLRPVKFLQALVVFSGSSAAAAFVTPALMTCYWSRATAKGAIAAMLAGAGTMFSLYSAGWMQNYAVAQIKSGTASNFVRWIDGILGPDPGIGIDNAFRPFYLGGVDPVLWGLGASAVAGVLVSLLTAAPSREQIDRFFALQPVVQPSTNPLPTPQEVR